jgi:hypothetical protein
MLFNAVRADPRFGRYGARWARPPNSSAMDRLERRGSRARYFAISAAMRTWILVMIARKGQ